MACSHPERIADLSQQTSAGAALLEEQSASARGAVSRITSSWRGSSGDAFQQAAGQLVTQIDRDAAVLYEIADALTVMRQTLEHAHELMHQAQDDLGGPAVSTWPLPSAEASAGNALLTQAREAVLEAVSTAVLTFSAIAPDSWDVHGSELTRVVHDVERAIALDVLAAITRPGGAAPPDGRRVGEVLKVKRGSIKNAELEPGSPSWAEVSSLTMAQVQALQRANVPGYKTIWKLLTDVRFNKPSRKRAKK